MALSFELSKELPEDVPVVAVPVCSDQLGRRRAGDGSPDLDWAYLEAQRLPRHARPDLRRWPPPTADRPPLVVGMGPSGEVGPDQLRRAGAAVARAAKRYPSVAIRLLDAVAEPARRPAAAQALAEGLVLGSYRFTTYKSEPDPAAARAGRRGRRRRRATGRRARARVPHRRRRGAGPRPGQHARRRAHPRGPGRRPRSRSPSGRACRSACSSSTTSSPPASAACSA